MALDVAVGSASDRDAAEVEAALADLASPDYALWNKAVHRLTDHGAAVVEPVVNEMRRRSHDPEYCTRAGMVLKALGPRRGRTLADALDRVDEPLPLQVLVEVIGALGDKPLIYRLKELIGRIRGRQGRSDGTNAFDPTQRAVAKAHLELARIGSRVAIQDLRDALTDRNRRLEVEMLGAVELIGKRDEIPDLLRAYLREDRYIRQRIGTAIRTIMRRERIRRSNRVFRAMGPRLDRALEQILSSRGSADRPQRQRVVKH